MGKSKVKKRSSNICARVFDHDALAAVIYEGIVSEVKDHPDVSQAALHVGVEFAGIQLAAFHIPNADLWRGAEALLVGCAHLESVSTGKNLGGFAGLGRVFRYASGNE